VIHILRHTFCSHLAMRGVPARCSGRPGRELDSLISPVVAAEELDARKAELRRVLTIFLIAPLEQLH
jgi:hypothetical protein